jgi:hypothetical protein
VAPPQDIADIYDRVKDVPYVGGIIAMAEDLPGDYARKVNTIVQLLESNCRPPWLVYVRTLLPALGQAVLVLLDFGWDDIARGFLRPYGTRSRFKFRRGKPRKWKLPEIPELGELIGKKLPGAKIVKARRVVAGERFLWAVDGVIQRGLWYWLIVDLVVETAYQWATNILESEYCRCPHDEGFDVYDELQSTGPVSNWLNLGLTDGDPGDYPFDWRNTYARLPPIPGSPLRRRLCPWILPRNHNERDHRTPTALPGPAHPRLPDLRHSG